MSAAFDGSARGRQVSDSKGNCTLIREDYFSSMVFANVVLTLNVEVYNHVAAEGVDFIWLERGLREIVTVED